MPHVNEEGFAVHSLCTSPNFFDSGAKGSGDLHGAVSSGFAARHVTGDVHLAEAGFLGDLNLSETL